MIGASETQAATFKSGFYAGGQIGGDFSKNKINAFQTPLDETMSGGAKKKAFAYNLNAGFRKFFNQDFFVGGNIAGESSRARLNKTLISDVPIQYDNKLKKRYTAIPALDAGKAITENFLMFLRLGMPITRFKIEDIIFKKLT